ncbi:MAG: HAMP domain-containing sensor histidine kinase [Dehalococcoidia bacterium]|nr:HAMP domain-containing sensor histidine kinase [Dehalococcoidia bacterium]
MRRFKFTMAFLVISALTLAIAAVVILRVSSGLEERNIAGMMTEQSARDAKLLAGAVSRILSEEPAPVSSDGAIKVSSGAQNEAGSTVGAFLGESDVVRLALYEIDGRSAWSSDHRHMVISGRSGELFRQAVAGEIGSGLVRDKRLPGASRSADVVETYVPFLGLDTDAPVRVLGVTRDVTDPLALRIGETRWAMFRATILALGSGFFLLLTFVVIADRVIWRSKEREIRRERELSEQRIASTRMDIENRELQRLDDERGKLIGLVSHELRTPLTSVLAFTEILSKRQSGRSAEKNREHLGVIKRSGSHLLEMIDEMLDMSRIESAEIPLDTAELDVSDLVTEIGQKIDPILQIKKQKLQVFGDVDGCRILADRGRLDQVLMNLLSNASKYSPPGTAIQLEVRLTRSELRASVRDQGIGIAEEDRRRIFGKFYRVDRDETRGEPGTGLGLAIVQSIIDRHGGSITVSSGLGGGSTFEFQIPTHVRRRAPSNELHPVTNWGYVSNAKGVAAVEQPAT